MNDIVESLEQTPGTNEGIARNPDSVTILFKVPQEAIENIELTLSLSLTID
jgi:hypothetical protein